MKKPIKLRILLFLQSRINAIPEGQKPPKWLIRACLIVTWFIDLPKKVKRLKNRILSVKVIMLFTNTYVLYFGKDKGRVFEGYFYKWFARKYADKRAKASRVNKLCGGKRHYAIDYGKDALIVLNRSEMNRLKTRHLFPKKYNIVDVLEEAYYVTK